MLMLWLPLLIIDAKTAAADALALHCHRLATRQREMSSGGGGGSKSVLYIFDELTSSPINGALSVHRKVHLSGHK